MSDAPTRKYRIAMVAACPFPANYGSAGSIREMSQTLAERGHDVHIVTYPFGEDIPVKGVTIHRVEGWEGKTETRVGPSLDRLRLDFALVQLVRKVVREHDIDVIHGHNYGGALAGIGAKLLTGKPFLYNAVNALADELAGYNFIRPRFVADGLAAALDWTVPKFPDHITVVSDQLYDWMIRRAKKEKVTVVPAGILPEMFDHADPSRVRHLYPEGDPPIVMYVGVLNAFQRIDYLLRAFTVVAKARPDAVLCVVHPVEGGTYLEGHKALAEELGIADRVRWIGPHTLEDLPNHLAMANVTVVPRPSCPGHPVKLLNAMIARRAAVCFAGSAKFVEHEKSALVAPDHDWEALGEAILRLVNDPELAARLADNARETVVAHFDWRVICRKIEAIYDGIVERPADDSADRKLVQRAG